MNGGARDEERVGRASHDHIELLPVSQQQGGFGAAGLRSRGYEYSDEAAETNEPTDVFTAGQGWPAAACTQEHRAVKPSRVEECDNSS